MGSNRDRRIDILHDRLWSAGTLAYRHTASPGRPARLTIPLDRSAPPLLVWPSRYPWWTFFQVPPESVNEWEQELVGLIRSFGPRVCEQAVCV
ncbi:MAG TPA: hypothetical protein VFH48_06800 [Chloroflexota bacterium]|nr:hypothetical protein [Chloroflexota bacterium]